MSWSLLERFFSSELFNNDPSLAVAYLAYAVSLIPSEAHRLIPFKTILPPCRNHICPMSQAAAIRIRGNRVLSTATMSPPRIRRPGVRTSCEARDHTVLSYT